MEVPNSLRNKHLHFLIKQVTRYLTYINFILEELEREMVRAQVDLVTPVTVARVPLDRAEVGKGTRSFL